jgi:methionyl-tRNA formyltransferase
VKAVFLGSPRSAVPALDALVRAGVSVPLVVTQPDRPAGRSASPRPTAVKEAAARLGIEVVSPASARTPELLAVIHAVSADALVVVAYGRILPREVLDAAPLGAVNVHFSLLPAYRGAAPVQWALARGEETSGVTTMQVSLRLDEGDVLLQRAVPIPPREHAPALLERLSRTGAELLVETLERLAAGGLAGTPQDPSRATYAPLLRASDGNLRFDLTAREIEGRVRGFDPWPGAWARHRGRRVRLVEAEALAARIDAPPGSVLDVADGAFHVACGSGTVLAVASIQLEGRRAVTAGEARNGRQLVPGDLLEALPAD